MKHFFNEKFLRKNHLKKYFEKFKNYFKKFKNYI